MYKQLTEIERQSIETGLNNNVSVTRIAQDLNRSLSSITREIKRNRVFKPYEYDKNQCGHKANCRKRHACGDPDCFSQCRRCPRCNQSCPSFLSMACKTRDRSPLSCNGCVKKARCRLDKYFYLTTPAQKAAAERLTESRRIIQLTDEELAEVNRIVTSGLRKKQPIYHIVASSDLPVSESTLYRYINRRILDACNLDLPRKVKRKVVKTGRKPQSDKIPGYRISKTYKDYNAFVENHPDIEVVQMDVVEGSGKKHLLTFTFTRSRFLLAFLIPDMTQHSVRAVFDALEGAIGHRRFKKLFQIILTDNGSEFQKHGLLEFTKGGIRRARIFYCDPYSSYQKGACEKNHTYIRLFLPKGTNFDSLSQNKVNIMLNNINSTFRESTKEDAPFSQLSPTMKNVVKKLGFVRIHPESVVLGPSVWK